jgi:hypothetical protein
MSEPEHSERWKNWSDKDKKLWAAAMLALAPDIDHPLADQLIRVMEQQGERGVHHFMFRLAMEGPRP